jgi:hypothetical protein
MKILSITLIIPLVGKKASNLNLPKKCSKGGRLESVRYREGGIEIQKVVTILKIPQIGKYVPLVVEGASESCSNYFIYFLAIL